MKNELLEEIKELILAKGTKAVEVINWKFTVNEDKKDDDRNNHYLVRTENGTIYEYHLVGGYTSCPSTYRYIELKERGSVKKTTKKEWKQVNDGKYEVFGEIYPTKIIERKVL